MSDQAGNTRSVNPQTTGNASGPFSSYAERSEKGGVWDATVQFEWVDWGEDPLRLSYQYLSGQVDAGSYREEEESMDGNCRLS